MDSPLLFPAKIEGEKILILDETQIPYKEEYLEVRSLDKALWVLGQMKTRSLGQVLLFFYSCVLFSDYSINQIVEKFKQTRPTFDFPFLGRILEGGIGQGVTIEKTVEGFVYGFDKARRQRAQRLAEILPEAANILTICNINGELIYLYREMKKIDKKALFIICETRPYLQGTRLTFWELRKNNIPSKLICDNQVAALMKKGEINCVVTGADRATKSGDVINKVGTYSIARIAKDFGIPFYSLIQYPRDIDIDKIEIEERPVFESFMYLEEDNKDRDAFYPSFDVTKAEFLTECIELKVS